MILYLIIRDDGQEAEVVFASAQEDARDAALLELLLACATRLHVWFRKDLIRLGDREIIDDLIAAESRDRVEA